MRQESFLGDNLSLGLDGTGAPKNRDFYKSEIGNYDPNKRQTISGMSSSMIDNPKTRHI